MRQEMTTSDTMECSNDTSFPFYGTILITLCGIIVIALILISLVLIPKKRGSKKTCEEELLSHAVVTGGSSGIGLAVAQDLIQRKCKVVSLLARNVKKLNDAKFKLDEYAKSVNSPTIVNIISVDVSNAEKITKVAEDLSTSDEFPVPSMIFNVAGTSTAAAFFDTDYKEFNRLMDINYLGSAYTTRAFVPYMVPKVSKDERRPARAIVFTSSQAGQCGIYGFTAYAPSKYALRGLAEALHMELARENVSVQMAFPPDTDTPGFEEEQIGKPEETKLISETSGLFDAATVARTIVASTLNPRAPFQIYFGLEGWMLAMLTAGMSPAQTTLDTMCQIFLKGLFRFISLFYLMDFRNIIKKVGMKKNEEASSENPSSGYGACSTSS